jgi:diguanylate cyclase with GGDEF domain
MPHRQVREHLLAALLKSPEDAILSVFLDGTIDTWSQGAKRVYGYTAKENDRAAHPSTRTAPRVAAVEENSLPCSKQWLGRLRNYRAPPQRRFTKGLKGGACIHPRRTREHYGILGARADPQLLWRRPLGRSPGPLYHRADARAPLDNRQKTAHHVVLGQRVGFLRDSPCFTLGPQRLRIPGMRRPGHRAERSHHAFTVLLLDLDGLKRINDLYGHLAGNRALQRLAVVMNEHCRSTDLAVRYGGDEFALVMIDSDRAWPSRSPTASGTACKPIGASRP